MSGRSRGRGDSGGGRGDYGGRGSRGQGDFGRGRGRDSGRGGGDFGGRPSRIAPDKSAETGTAARPGKLVPIRHQKDVDAKISAYEANYADDIKELMKAPTPFRPGFGGRGQTIKVRVNHFQVECSLQAIVHYDVKILPAQRGDAGPRAIDKPLPVEIMREVIREAANVEQWGPGWAYDGKHNVFATSNCIDEFSTGREIAIADPETGRQRSFHLKTANITTIRATDLLNFIRGNRGVTYPQVAIQALDVALRQSALMSSKFILAGRNSVFQVTADVRCPPLGGGAEVWQGWTQSLRVGEGCLTLNVDMACTAFLQEVPVLQYLANAAAVHNVDSMNNVQFKKARKAIMGLKVEVTHMGNRRRKYKVKELEAKGPAQLMFMNEAEGREMSVGEYFEKQYKMRLQHPNGCCLNVGSRNRPVYLPPEVCKIARGQRRLKLDERQTAEMIKTAAKSPEDRARQILSAVNEQAKFPQDPSAAAFGLKVSSRMMEIEARVLPAPALLYSRPQPPPRGGAWNLRNTAFHTGAKLTAYAVASFSPAQRVGHKDDPSSIQAFISELLIQLGRCGLSVLPDPMNLPEVVFHDPYRAFPGETLNQAVECGGKHFKAKPDIIFVLLPDTNAELYNEVKRASDSYIGIPSQCFVARKASIGIPQTRPRDQYTANLALKINAKLNGINVIIEPRMQQSWQREPYMIMGADVTYMAAFSEKNPSIASVCASIDQHSSRFASLTFLQGHRVEIIEDLKTMTEKLLITFYKHTGKRKPQRIIMYRDGVSEGQFSQVQQIEIPQIAAACRELGDKASEPYNPALTFIVVQKGHNTRMFPMSNNEADRSGNCQPGTVVDRRIVHPNQFSFFLNSHAGLQGTNKPALYTVLLDQSRFGADDLQAFTYNSTYTFARCTRSVSLCPAAYYAHLAAARGRCLLRLQGETTDAESTSAETEKAEFAPIHANLSHRMYYV